MSEQPQSPEPQGQALSDLTLARLAAMADVNSPDTIPYEDYDALHSALRELQQRRAAQAIPIPQEDLPADAAKVLRDNLWNLYDGTTTGEQRRAAQGEPITREWCMAAAKAEDSAGDPDCTTGQPAQGQAALVRELRDEAHGLDLLTSVKHGKEAEGFAHLAILLLRAADALAAAPVETPDVEAVLTVDRLWHAHEKPTYIEPQEMPAYQTGFGAGVLAAQGQGQAALVERDRVKAEALAFVADVIPESTDQERMYFEQGAFWGVRLGLALARNGVTAISGQTKEPTP